MVIVTTYAAVKKEMESNAQAVVLLSIVLINIFVWLIEQLIHVNFEFLSISYIITEVFLICLHFIMEHERMLGSKPAIQQTPLTASSDESLTLAPQLPEPEQGLNLVYEVSDSTSYSTETSTLPEERIREYLEGLSNLTPTERIIYDLYVSKKTTKEIMASLDIKENTLKFHNKNIYGKLGVSSRKVLIETHQKLNL